MALVQCRECGKMVSEEADVCPYCGAKMPSKKRKQRRLFISIILLLILAGGMIWTYFHFASNTQQANGGSTSAPSKIQKDIPVKEQVMQKDYEEKVSELLDSGMSVMKISKQTGIRIDEVRRIKKEKKKADE